MPVKGGGGGGGGSAQGVRAGRAYVELAGDDTKLARALMSAKARIMGLGSSLAGIGTKSLGVGAALLAPLTAFLVSGIQRTADIEDLADVFGLTADSASRMAYAFEVAGLSVADMEGVLKELSKSNTTGKPIDEYLSEVTAALNAMEDPSARAGAAMELMGKKGIGFLKIARQFEGLKGEATPLTEKDIANAEAMSQAWNKIGIAIRSSLLPMLDILVPLIQQLVTFVKANAHLLLILGMVGAGLVAFGVSAMAASAVITSVVTAAGLLVSGLGLLLTPMGLVAAAIAVVLFNGEALKKGFGSLLETATASWDGILAAIKKGDIELAFKVMGAGLMLEWKKVLLYWTEQWVKFKNGFLNDLHQLALRAEGTFLFKTAKETGRLLKVGANNAVDLAEGALRIPIGLAKLAGIGGGGGAPAPAPVPAAVGPVISEIGARLGLVLGDKIGQALGPGIAKMVNDENALDPNVRKARAEIAAADARLAELLAQANAPGAVPDAAGADRMKEHEARKNLLADAFDTVKGGFYAGLAKQQFGYADTVNKRQEDLLKKIVDGKGGLPGKIGEAVAEKLKLK